MNKRFHRSIFIATVIALMVPSGAVAYDASFEKSIHHEILNAFGPPVEKKVPEPSKKPSGIKEHFKELFEIPIFTEPTVSPRARLQAAFELFPKMVMPEQSVIDVELINKLEILQGGMHGDQNLIKQLVTITQDGTKEDILYTSAGIKSFTEIVSMPITDFKTIQARQQVIKALMSDKALLSQASPLLQTMRDSELYLYDIYQKEGLSLGEQMLYPTAIMELLGVSEMPAFVTLANRVYAGLPLFVTALSVLPPAIMAKYTIGREQQQALFQAGGALVIGTLGGSVHFGQIRKQLASIVNIQLKMINVTAYVRSAQKLVQLVAQLKATRTALPELEEKMLAYISNKAGSPRFQKFMKLLQSKTFDGPLPSKLSSPGNILLAYKLINEKEIKQQLGEFLDFAGKLDVFVALARKMNAHESGNAQFCFATFDTQSNKPYIKAAGIWNPFVPASQVIPNDFDLNVGKERNVLLTGPNTSGKSTFVKAIMIALIMAQTFGVAPARSLTFTPFANLLSYMSVTDDVSRGLSQFKAETIRANELKKIVMGLAPNEFAFFILDEIFTGTAPEQAEKLSFDFIKNLSKFPNVLFINASHFKKMAELEQLTSGVTKNYHLTADVDKNNQVIRYTRKLKQGVAPYSSAEQVARESGLTETWGRQAEGNDW